MSEPKDIKPDSGELRCSSRRTWQDIQGYVGRKFRGIDPDDNRRKTLKVIDVTLGGDVWICRGRFGRSKWDQDRFLKFIGRSVELAV